MRKARQGKKRQEKGKTTNDRRQGKAGIGKKPRKRQERARKGVDQSGKGKKAQERPMKAKIA